MKKIELSGKHGEGKFALVDDEDFEELNKFKWKVTVYGNYAVRSKYKNKSLRMHRVIMDAKKGTILDHINGNPLDNRKENLRFVTNRQNSINSKPHKNSKSKYKGVSYKKDHNRWMACISVDGKHKHLGYFKTEKKAAIAWNKFAKKYHGKYARLNKL